MHLVGYRYQRTLARPAIVAGRGFVAGAAVTATFLPAPPDTGVVFVRTDRPGRPATPARVGFVTGTARRTTLGPAGGGVTLVEHVLAALAGLRIDNCNVELDGPEPPGLDGSALGFVQALAVAGAELQYIRRPIFAPREPIAVSADGATIALHPAVGTGLTMSYLLDYGPLAPIPRQAVTVEHAPAAFARELAACRTFVMDHEVAALRAQGVGLHLTASDLLVFGPRGVVGNRLRFGDEPARHKLLDVVGDLALCGFDLAGHLVAYRSGHALNAELAALLQSSSLQVVKSSGRTALSRAA